MNPYSVLVSSLRDVTPYPEKQPKHLKDLNIYSYYEQIKVLLQTYKVIYFCEMI